MHTISVVIPTLGGPTLKNTIGELNSGNCVPAEILVCIPENQTLDQDEISFNNVKVIRTEVRGQVAQRAAGFKRVKYDLVLQLDDDIHVDENTLQILADNLKRMGRGNAVGPVYYDINNSGCLHKQHTGIKGFLQNLYAFAVCGAPWGKKRMGRLTAIGIGYGVDNTLSDDKVMMTDWLPGGCVMMFRDDLIKDSFYPYEGKAYSEDILHSLLRRNNNITHYVLFDAKCKTHTNPVLIEPGSFFSDMRARKFILGYTSGKVWHLWIWCIVDYLKRAVIYCFLMLNRKSVR